MRRSFILGLGLLILASTPALAAEKPLIAKVCQNCHQAQPGNLRGTFDSVSFKSRALQIRLDDAVEVVKFDPDYLKVTNGASTEGSEFLRTLKKNHEVRVSFVEKDGVKFANGFSLKQPMSVPEELLIPTSEVEKLVAQGPEKGKYTLIDSRPLMRYQEGFIPTAKNLPYPSFDKLTDRLPSEKATLLIFYCGGPTCSMSPKSAEKARALGYTNVRVYHEGIPGWSARNPAVLTAPFLKEAWFDKEMPVVLLDARPPAEASKGFIKGAAVLQGGPLDAAISALKLPPADKKPPIVVYDGGTGTAASTLAAKLVTAGYNGVRILEGGFPAWQAAKFTVEQGTPAATVAWAPKPRAGEIPYNDFVAAVKAKSEDTIILDVRPASEAQGRMISGAKHIPADEMDKRFSELPKDKKVVAYCATGVQAEMVYHVLKEKGYDKVSFVNATLNIEPDGTFSRAVAK